MVTKNLSDLDRREAAARLSQHLSTAPTIKPEDLAMARPLTPTEKLSRTWWRFWYTARPVVLGAVGSMLPTLVVYLMIGWTVVDEMETRDITFTSMDSYVYGIVSWPRSLAYITAGTDDMVKTLKGMEDLLNEINSGRWERKPPAPKK